MQLLTRRKLPDDRRSCIFPTTAGQNAPTTSNCPDGRFTGPMPTDEGSDRARRRIDGGTPKSAKARIICSKDTPR